MAIREGSLEAPTRHPLDWKAPDFYDQTRIDQELGRVFDICHGCRRCVNLCTAFPRLFDLIDEGPTGELDGVPKERYREVVDQCYLCDMCYMTKCPYVPPHPWNVDFPHVMLRAKAAGFKKNGAKLRDRMLSSTDALGKLATIPVVVQIVNGANRNSVARSAMHEVLGVHRDRELPPYAAAKFRNTARPASGRQQRDGKNVPGKVALFATCYVNYNEPAIGHDLLKVLEHNGIPAVLLEKEACCGMPKFELGDLDAVARLKEVNIPVLAALARNGYALMTLVPSCTLMLRKELALMFPQDPDVKAVAGAMCEPLEYLLLRHRDGLLRTDFKKPLGNVSYHVPCHMRVQNIGQKTRELLEMVPGTKVHTVERCSGHDGTWGVKVEYFENSMKIGRPVFRQMSEPAPQYVSSDCPIAARQIMQGMGDIQARKEHPITLMRIAYGL
jgi:glycerol-3-phosphate dehydrogenase subunit C